MADFLNGADQHSLDWYRTRLGKITGSEVGKIMVSGRKKEDLFGETAKSYLYEIAYERDLNPAIVGDDFQFGYYIEQTSIHSKAMDFGTENESDARSLYTKVTGNEVVECPSVTHPRIDNFSSSPDGYICQEKRRGCLEIKCLGKSNFGKYRMLVKTPEDLKAVNSQYYWQCISHMSVTGASWCDFFVYNPFSKHPYILVRIDREEEVIKTLEDRVVLANEFIENNK